MTDRGVKQNRHRRCYEAFPVVLWAVASLTVGALCGVLVALVIAGGIGASRVVVEADASHRASVIEINP